MFEGRMKSTGWGYTGHDKRGYEWMFTPDESDPVYCADPLTGKPYDFCCCRSGYVFKSEDAAVRNGKRWMKECKRSGVIRTVKSSPRLFEY